MTAFKKYAAGVCYYPEHWPETLWEEDLRRMLASGLRTVRVAEFAWSIFEKVESQYDFSFFKRFLDLCERVGMQVILGTPSATPPAWLTEKYPEVLNADDAGNLYRHGGRRHYNYNSLVYREKTALLVQKMAEAYGHHPAVIGWQIDNELNCETNEFLSEADQAAFRKYLQKKYTTLHVLNEVWGTVFWSQTYTSWNQVSVPRLNAIHAHNPSLLLDYIRFVSESAISFADMQAKMIRTSADEKQFITTNGMFGHLDNHRLSRDVLDVYMYDSYPDFWYGVDQTWDENCLHDRNCSLQLIRVRSICPHFGIMEQQSGANGWYNRMEAPMPRPGQMELWAMQSVAHGADYVSFFRWRTSPVGTEIYWHGILDYDNRDNRRLREVKAFTDDLEKIAEVCGADADARFAVLTNADNLFDAELDAWHRRVDQVSRQGIFEAAQALHVTYNELDIRASTDLSELNRYPVLFAPHFVITTPELAGKLNAYVEQGGTLIVGCRTGYKNLHGTCPMRPMPGDLRNLTGTTVEEYSFASPAEEPVSGLWDYEELPAACFTESLKADEGTEICARYQNGYLEDEPLLTCRKAGKGQVWHFGSTFSKAASMRFLQEFKLAEPYAAYVQVPESLEIVGRVKEGHLYLFILNYLPTGQHVELIQPMVSLLTGEEVEGDLALPGYGVCVLKA